jgi:aldehyde dehydrogenase (NAD+)
MSTTALQQYRHYIAGEWVEPADDRFLPSYNPATGEPWYELARGDAADVDRAVRAARAAFEAPAWRRLTATARGRLLRRLGDLVADHGDESPARRPSAWRA